MTAAFIGHRNIIPANIENELRKTVEQLISVGYNKFIMGAHGEFDKMALAVCRSVREEHPEIEIEVVLTNLEGRLKKDEYGYDPYHDVKTVIFDIEEVYYKQRIMASNRRMVDLCDTLICYVDTDLYYFQSCSKRVYNYAKRKGVNIINLYKI